MTSTYRGRLAPSPTGYLHVGHAHTFWSAYGRARNAGGTLVMRMEDLDSERSRQIYADAAIEDLHWLGIDWQEGPDCGGPFGPYAQSKRYAHYLAAWRALLRGGHLFPCRCSRKDLAAALSAPHENRRKASSDAQDDNPADEPLYPGLCRQVAPASSDLQSPGAVNWRFRVPDGEAIEFEDLNLGPQRFVAGVDFGDFPVWRRDGAPSYQLACIVDDAAMKITEVVRGADLLKSTARQILLNRALGHKDPAWFHCPLAVDANGRRLAKRHDALSLRALRQRGLTPAQVLSMELATEA